STVRAGTTLRFTVTLTNPTKTPVLLRPCPGYTEAMYSNGRTVQHTFRVKCAPVGTIAPHKRVRFEMRLAVPAHATGASKLGRSLDTPTGPFTAGIVQVVG